jgi:hypothetical protein
MFGAIYLARDEVSAVAEFLSAFRGRAIEPADLQRTDGRVLALVGLNDRRIAGLPDLDEPRELDRRRLRPSLVATHKRTVTQALAEDLFQEGVPGFSWWSTLEASWQNVTLFAERALGLLEIDGGPRQIAIDDHVLREAATAVGVRLA